MEQGRRNSIVKPCDVEFISYYRKMKVFVFKNQSAL